MKRLCVATFCLLLILSLSSYSFSQVEVPAPFAKAKELALKVEPDSLGRYIVTFEAQDTSYVLYIIAYLSQSMIIGVGKTINGTLCVAEYHEKEKRFTMYIRGMRRQEVEATTVIAFAFQVFRELVAKKLI